MVKMMSISLYRSTPVECLHTVLLGSYKYLFGDLMDQITAVQKDAISARIDAFPPSGIDLKLSKSACRYTFIVYVQHIIIMIILFNSSLRYYQSFHGKDFKALAQIAPFVLWDELNDDQKSVWLSLSKVGF